MRELVEEWLKYLRDVRRCPPNTLRAYRNDVRGLEEFTRPAIRAALAAAHGRASGRSLARKLHAIRSLGGWLVRRGVIKRNVALEIDAPRVEQTLPETISIDQAFGVLAAPDPITALGARDRAILEVAYGGGMRVSEVAKLNLADVDLAAGEVRVRHAKGDRDRITVIGESAVNATRLWLMRRWELRGAKGQQDPDALFVADRGTRLDVRSIHRLVLAAARKAGLAWLHPHQLRHACASHLLADGASLPVISQHLGHAALSVTAKYVSVSLEQMQRDYRRAHPLDRLAALDAPATGDETGPK